MPRDVLRELDRLARAAEPDALNVGAFVAENAVELAPLLGSTEADLTKAEGCPDEVVVTAVRSRLDLALEAQRQRRRDEGAALAEKAAGAVGSTARWFELGVVIDVDLVLGQLLSDLTRKYVAFVLPETLVVVEAVLLRRARMLKRTFLDAAVFVDDAGVHFRWKGGRGRLNLKSQAVSPSEMQRALAVPIPPPLRSPMPAFVGVSAE
jgi:hypothetical protein